MLLLILLLLLLLLFDNGRADIGEVEIKVVVVVEDATC